MDVVLQKGSNMHIIKVISNFKKTL